MEDLGTTFVRVKLDTTDAVSQMRRMAAVLEGTTSVFLLTSETYLPESDKVVGVFASREAAEAYAREAVPPVSDARISEWQVSA